VRYFLQKNPELKEDSEAVRDVCAGIQKAISQVLVTKLFRAAARDGVSCVT
jgi:tRNA A37 threonylcarbamoyltransferase TsaD